MKNLDDMFENNLNYVQDNFLTKNECEQALKEFDEFEKSKSMMRAVHQYFAVGNSFLEHLDAATNRTIQNRTADNIKIASEKYFNSTRLYSPTHDLLLTKFQNLFDINVKYFDKLSIPGYSYALPNNGINEQPAHLWHYDDEKNFYPYSAEFPDYTDLSYFDDIFTMTIMLTQGDFTYDYYKETYMKWPRPANSLCNAHVRFRGDVCSNPDCKLNDYVTVKYNQGTVNIGRQCRLHRIGKSVFTGDSRIAIQTHSVLKNNTLYLYW
jgi:hypothetical protein